MSNLSKIESYARLAVEKGVGFKKGQKLLIRSDVNAAYFARMLAKVAWELGAEDVFIRYMDEKEQRLRFLNGGDDIFGIRKKYLDEFMKQMVDDDYQLIAVLSNDPENLKGVDTDRIAKETKMISEASKPLSDRASAGDIQWSLAAIPSPSWAMKVFPNEPSEEAAIEKMWDAIFVATRVNEGDPVKNWIDHVNTLADNARKLQNCDFDTLTFKNSYGTNLEIGLPEGHFWASCGEKAKTGNVFIANIPTEEVFTAPHRDRVNGIVYATKPLVYMGNIIDKFWIKFEKGKVVDYKAEIGHDILEKMITIHEDADRLGEVALVPHSSPISASGILWYNTLYDENASCHIALGRGYAFTLPKTQGLSEEEAAKMGLNQSLSHNDFMIGSACLSITGKTTDGLIVEVFKDGEWAI